MLSPNEYDTYAEWRKEVYNEAPPTKIEQIEKWLNANEPEITIADLEALIEKHNPLRSQKVAA